MVISSWLASNLVDGVFANPDGHSSHDVLLGVYGYAIQIYADFSGYTDIAIGVALLLGFRFPTNFDCPYRALSLRDFWKRWHITLSSWLRDYLYIPLGGNRGRNIETYRNLLITMILGGLWHGSTWNFVIWGLIHGVALIAERLIPRGNLHPVLRWLITFHVICFAWVFFRADSFTDALDVLTAIVTSPGDDQVSSLPVLLLLAGALGTQFISKAQTEQFRQWCNQHSAITQGVMFGIGLVLIDLFGPEGVAPFIYFQF